MVTRPTPQRVRAAVHSIAGYCRQTCPGTELVIIVDRGDPDDVAALISHLGSLGRRDIRAVLSTGERTLGELRNLGIEHAGGELICQWDDDDLYHPERLERQSAALVEGGHAAVLLQEVIQYFVERNAMYLTNWRATPAGGHPGTLMVRRDASVRYPDQGAEAARGEDLAVALALVEQGRMGYLGGAGHLHVYVSHGANVSGRAHHAFLVERLAISKGLLRRREVEIRAGLAPFGLPPDSIDVIGNNGIAFRL